MVFSTVGFPGGASGKESTCQCRRHETQVWSLSQEDPLKEEMATHSSILAWKIQRSLVGYSPWGCRFGAQTRLSTTQQNRHHQIKENTGPLTVQIKERKKIHPESRQGRSLGEPASLLLPQTKKIKKRKERMLGAKRWDVRQKANFNPIRGVGTGPSVQKAQSTGVVEALAVSSQHLIPSLHTGLTDFQLQHQQCSVWGRSVTTRASSVHVRWTRRIKSLSFLTSRAG